jgi:hypothetical protein
MSHKTIRSKWADFLECYKKGDVMVSMGNNVYRTPGRLRYWYKESLDSFLFGDETGLKNIPRYVFSDDTKDIINSRETMETIEILKKFGRYHLPYPVCAAEYDYGNAGVRLFAFVYEKKDKCLLDKATIDFPFYVHMFALYDFSNPELARSLKHKDGTLRSQKFAIIYPLFSEMENIPGEAFANDPTANNIGGIRYQTQPVPWISLALVESTAQVPFDREAVIKEYTVRAGFAVRALTSLMQTKGIKEDVVSTTDLAKLNKKRASNKTPLIPEHVYITLGHGYDKAGRKTAGSTTTGRKMRFHMRSAHIKRQHYGPKNSLVKDIMVEAYLVNAESGGELYNPQRIVKA